MSIDAVPMNRPIAILVLATLVAAAPVPAAGSNPRDLGGFEVCEASAALLSDCPDDPTRTCLLIGDNEQRGSIFAIPFDGRALDVEERTEIDIEPVLEGDRELSDIEALARLTSGEVLIYGSHSRNKSCKRRGKRRQYVGVRLAGASAAPGDVRPFKTGKNANLFEAIPGSATGTLGAVRKAIEEAENQADSATGATDCTPQAFNIEGVVALAGASGDEVWIGLRAPTLNGNAVLLKQVAGLGSFGFDAARLVDLGGWAIRDLTYARGWIWGLAGPVADNSTLTFKLFRFPASALAAEDLIAVEEVAQVPNSSEGLAIFGRTAIVLVDGDEPPDQEEIVVTVDDVVVVDGEGLEADDKKVEVFVDGRALSKTCVQPATYVTVAVDELVKP